MKNTCKLFLSFSIMLIFSQLAVSNDYGAVSNSQNNAMQQTLTDSATLQQMQEQRWNSYTDRERYLISLASTEFYKFKYDTGHYPTKKDTGFIKKIFLDLQIKKPAEQKIIINQIHAKIDHKAAEDDLHKTICSIDKEFGFAASYADCD